MRYSRRSRQRSPLLVLALVLALALGGFWLFRDQLNALVSPAPPAGASVPGSPEPAPSNGQTAPPELPSPTPTPADPMSVATAYVKAWEEKRYADMYSLISTEAKQEITSDQFIERYQNIADMATIHSLTADITGTATTLHDGTIEVPIHVEMQTRRVGDIVEDNFLPLVNEGSAWRVQWSPSLIFKDLTADYLIRLFPLNPQRGSILDRKGRPLATQGHVVSVGVVPAEIEDQAQIVAAIQPLATVTPEQLAEKIDNAQPDWFVPLAEFPAERETEIRKQLESVPGFVIRRKPARIYPAGTTAANIVGYMSVITAEELPQLSEKGYEPDDRLGRSGIEGWGEEYLAGKRGGKLAVVTPKGEVVKIIKDQPAQEGQNIHLSIDLDIQRQAEQALGEKPGSVVVMDPRDNSVLALATFPRFDPSKFITGFTPEEWTALNDDPRHPFLNRPVASSYPTGSVFKVITMAAGIETGGFTPNSTFDCRGIWFGLGPGIGFRDWTPAGHGLVTLQRGITTSCNIVFYEIGKTLGGIDPFALPNMARRFGLGAPSGLVGLQEIAGVVPDPTWKERALQEQWFPGDSVNLAIGQGYLLATPIQMANVYSTVASNGVRRPPVLVQRITDVEGKTVKTFEAKPEESLGLSPTYFASVREGMIQGTASKDGTAYYAFYDYRVPTAGKTGSAENPGPNSHAWFGGFAPANDPQAVVLVMVEGAGAGSEFAAPIGRKIFEFMFPNPPARPQ